MIHRISRGLGALALAIFISPAIAQQTPAVQYHFNQSVAQSFDEPYRHVIRPGVNFENILAEHIGRATQSVSVAVSALTLPRVAQALAASQSRGVQVRVILDHEYRRDWAALAPDEVASLSEEEQGVWAEVDNLVDTNHDGDLSEDELNANDVPTLFSRHGVALIDDTEDGSKGSGIMHHKFVVIDGRWVLTSSANFTHSAFFGDIGASNRGNAENLIVIDSAELAALYQEEFQLMWGDGPGGLKNSRFGLRKPHRPARLVSLGEASTVVQFGPTSTTRPLADSLAGTVINAINRATRSAQIAMYVLTDQTITDALRDAYLKPGLQLSTLIDASFVFNEYSASLDMWGLHQLTTACQLKKHSRPWAKVAPQTGMPVLNTGDKLHHKFAVLDGQTVLTGSYNWTDSGLRDNDENLLVIASQRGAAEFANEFRRLQQTAAHGPSASLRAQIQAQATRCAL